LLNRLWEIQLRSETLGDPSQAALLKEERNALLARSLSGPLPRATVAEAAGLELPQIRNLCVDRGFWLRSRVDEGGLVPFERTISEMMGDRCSDGDFWAFIAEVEADMAAQLEIEKIRRRWESPPEVPPQIGCWRIDGVPFPAVDKRDGLGWWVDCVCTAPGCQHRVRRWKNLTRLKRSKAKTCQQHNKPADASLTGWENRQDEWARFKEKHVPALLDPSARAEICHPDMAQGALADFNRLLENPPSTVVTKPPKPIPAPGHSQYFDSWAPPPPFDPKTPSDF